MTQIWSACGGGAIYRIVWARLINSPTPLGQTMRWVAPPGNARPERRVHSSARERDASSLQEISPLATLGRNDSHLRSNVIRSASPLLPCSREGSLLVPARDVAPRESSGLASHSFRSSDGARDSHVRAGRTEAVPMRWKRIGRDGIRQERMLASETGGFRTGGRRS